MTLSQRILTVKIADVTAPQLPNAGSRSCLLEHLLMKKAKCYKVETGLKKIRGSLAKATRYILMAYILMA